MRNLVREAINILKTRGVNIPESAVNFAVADADKVLLKVDGEVTVKRRESVR